MALADQARDELGEAEDEALVGQVVVVDERALEVEQVGDLVGRRVGVGVGEVEHEVDAGRAHPVEVDRAAAVPQLPGDELGRRVGRLDAGEVDRVGGEDHRGVGAVAHGER